jgi:hypothetical protein
LTGQQDALTQATGGDSSRNFSELGAAVADVGQLGVNVRAGRVRLDPAVGAQLLATMRAHADDIAAWQQRVDDLARPLPLGNNPVSTSMGAKFNGRAQGRDTALATVLAQYRDAVLDASDAIEQAMRGYAATENAIHDALRRISAT